MYLLDWVYRTPGVGNKHQSCLRDFSQFHQTIGENWLVDFVSQSLSPAANWVWDSGSYFWVADNQPFRRYMHSSFSQSYFFTPTIIELHSESMQGVQKVALLVIHLDWRLLFFSFGKNSCHGVLSWTAAICQNASFLVLISEYPMNYWPYLSHGLLSNTSHTLVTNEHNLSKSIKLPVCVIFAEYFASPVLPDW